MVPKTHLLKITKNIGLIKRRIKSSHLKTIEYKLGRYSKTATGLLYIDNIAKKELVKELDNKLSNIDTDIIIDAGSLKQYLSKESKNFFPPTKLTERPDVIVEALLEGKVVIILDTCPLQSSPQLFLPTLLIPYQTNIYITTMLII